MKLNTWICSCMNLIKQHFFVFQTIQSEQLLSEQGEAKLNLSSAVLEESQQLNETTQGQFTHGPV